MSEAFDPDALLEGDSLFGLPTQVADARLVVLPVPFEATTSFRRGTAGGPSAIRTISGQIDLWDSETGEPWRAGIAMDESPDDLAGWNATACADADLARSAGDAQAIERVNQVGQRLNDLVHRWTSKALSSGRIPAILGGDHSVPLGAMRAAVEGYPGLGFLHIDAHADLRAGYEGFTYSHASIIYNLLALGDVGPVVQVGVRDQCAAERKRASDDARISQWLDADIGSFLARGRDWADLVAEMLAPLPEHVWITFDIDGLDPSLCPNTGTPVPGGLSWHRAMFLLAALSHSGRTIVGFDLCEVANQEWDAIVGSRVLYKLAGWALAPH